MTKRWTNRPPGSTWGDWGDDDELGRINLLTPEKVLEGVVSRGIESQARAAVRGAQGDPVVVAGSLYLVGAVRGMITGTGEED